MTDFAGIPIVMSPHMENGTVYLVGGQVYVGSRPLTNVEATIRRIVIDVFGKPFLNQIGYPTSTTEEIMVSLNKRSVAKIKL